MYMQFTLSGMHLHEWNTPFLRGVLNNNSNSNNKNTSNKIIIAIISYYHACRVY